MPRISEFLGIVIFIYSRDVKQHHAPHFHAYYGEYAAAYSIQSGTVIAGEMPPRQDRRIRQWIEVRRDELMDNWNRMLQNRPLEWIRPL